MISIWWSTETTIQDPEGGDVETLEMQELRLDVLEQEEYVSTSDVTSHPVEDGAPITDHILTQQGRVSLTVVVSDSPVTTELVEGSSVGEGGILIVPEQERRTVSVHDQLRALCQEGILVDVEGLRETLDGWAISKVSAPWEAATRGAMVCQIELVEVLIAETEEVDAPAPRVERGRRRRDRGDQRGEEGEDASVSNETSERQSALAAVRDSLAGLIGGGS